MAQFNPGDNSVSTVPTALHIAIWNGNLKQIRQVLKKGASVETRDRNGNRALHLALQCCHDNLLDIIQVLYEFRARVRSKDLDGWRTIHHAIATNNEEIVADLLRNENKQLPLMITEKVKTICEQVARMRDFQAVLTFDIHSWVPILSRLLPSDTIRIWKSKENLRFDISLIGFEHLSWKRGNLSFLVLGKEKKLLTIDHDTKTFSNWFEGQSLTDDEIRETIHLLFTHKMMSTDVNTSDITFRPRTHWLSSSETREDVASWKQTRVYDMENFVLKIKARPIQNPRHVLKGKKSDAESTTEELKKLLKGLANDKSAITVEAGKSYSVPIEMQPKQKIGWKFNTVALDIAFSATFCPEDTVTDDDTRNLADGNSVTVKIVPEKRVSKEESGEYEASESGTLILHWDNSYSLWTKKQLEYTVFPIGDESEVDESECGETSSESSFQSLGNMIGTYGGDCIKLTPFKEFFGMEVHELPPDLQKLHPKKSIHMVQQPKCKEYNKQFSASICLTEEFPLSSEEFEPVLDVLAKTSPHLEKIRDFFDSAFPSGLFPVKFTVPLFPSIGADVCFQEMELKTPTEDVFAVPSTYTFQKEEEATSVQPSETMATLSDHYIS